MDAFIENLYLWVYTIVDTYAVADSNCFPKLILKFRMGQDINVSHSSSCSFVGERRHKMKLLSSNCRKSVYRLMFLYRFIVFATIIEDDNWKLVL